MDTEEDPDSPVYTIDSVEQIDLGVNPILGASAEADVEEGSDRADMDSNNDNEPDIIAATDDTEHRNADESEEVERPIKSAVEGFKAVKVCVRACAYVCVCVGMRVPQ